MDTHFRKIPLKQHRKVLALYKRMSARDVAKHFNVSYQAIINIVRQNGGTVRPNTQRVRR